MLYKQLLKSVFKSVFALSTLTTLTINCGSAFAVPVSTDHPNYDYEDIDTDIDNDGGTKWENHLISGGVGFLFGYIVGNEVQKRKSRNYDQYVNQHPPQQEIQPYHPAVPENIKIVPASAGEPNCKKIVKLKSGQKFCELAH
jgi:hypothetical protein